MVTRDGRVYEAESTYPPGHWRNPLTREQVEEKFWRLTRHLLEDEGEARRALEELWRLEQVRDLGRVLRMLRVRGWEHPSRPTGAG